MPNIPQGIGNGSYFHLILLRHEEFTTHMGVDDLTFSNKFTFHLILLRRQEFTTHKGVVDLTFNIKFTFHLIPETVSTVSAW